MVVGLSALFTTVKDKLIAIYIHNYKPSVHQGCNVTVGAASRYMGVYEKQHSFQHLSGL
jgi:hypothetical protein